MINFRKIIDGIISVISIPFYLGIVIIIGLIALLELLKKENRIMLNLFDIKKILEETEKTIENENG